MDGSWPLHDLRYGRTNAMASFDLCMYLRYGRKTLWRILKSQIFKTDWRYGQSIIKHDRRYGRPLRYGQSVIKHGRRYGRS